MTDPGSGGRRERRRGIDGPLVMIGLGIAFLVRRSLGGGEVGIVLHRSARRRAARPEQAGVPVTRPIRRARSAQAWPAKLPGLRRELDARSLFSVAYGEIASSIYFALGIIALHAVGFTPLVLLGVGVLFLVVALSYAEATSALPETGGAATFVRKAYNDLAGFMTGWVLFLDYLIVIALSALFVPHYLAGALQIGALDRNPWDVVVGVAVIVAVGSIRLVRRPSMYAIGIDRSRRSTC